MMSVHIGFHHLIGVERFDAAAGGHAQRIADEFEGVVVLEKRGILGKNGALRRFVAIGFEGHQSIAAGAAEKLVHHLERVEIFLLIEARCAENTGDACGNFFQDVQRIGNQERAGGSAADNEELGGLKQNGYVAVLHQVAGYDCAEDDDDADDHEHEKRRSLDFGVS